MTRWIVLLIALLPGLALAQTYDRSFKDWSVFNYNDTCYIGTAPIKQAGNYTHRGQPYVLVISRSKDVDEVNISSGYPYQSGKDVQITIDSKNFQLFTKDEVAWAYDEMTDAAIVAAMKAGNELTVHGVSQKGTLSDDTYSLSGFSAAYEHMKTKCK